jgi:hypothetical protein
LNREIRQRREKGRPEAVSGSRLLGTDNGELKTACQTAAYDPKDHFAGISKMVDAEQEKLPKQIEGFESPTTEP